MFFQSVGSGGFESYRANVTLHGVLLLLPAPGVGLMRVSPGLRGKVNATSWAPKGLEVFLFENVRILLSFIVAHLFLGGISTSPSQNFAKGKIKTRNTITMLADLCCPRGDWGWRFIIKKRNMSEFLRKDVVEEEEKLCNIKFPIYTINNLNEKFLSRRVGSHPRRFQLWLTSEIVG